MAKKITVILLEDIHAVGTAGEVVSVSEGYARNSLFPNGSAAIADDATLQSVERKAASQRAADNLELAQHQAVAEKLEGTELLIIAKAKEGEGGDLYGSITAAAIAKELLKQADLKVKPKDVGLDEPITSTGSYDVTIAIAADVEATLTVTVTTDKAEEENGQDDE